MEIKASSPIRLVDVQGLVLWTLCGADCVGCPRWVFVKVRLSYASGGGGAQGAGGGLTVGPPHDDQ